MSVSQLEYFIAVAEEGHLCRAAQRLHICQPPLSRQIRLLEEELGEPLFERSRRGMKLLPLGERFLCEARDVVERFHRLRCLLRTRQGHQDDAGPSPTGSGRASCNSR